MKTKKYLLLISIAALASCGNTDFSFVDKSSSGESSTTSENASSSVDEPQKTSSEESKSSSEQSSKEESSSSEEQSVSSSENEPILNGDGYVTGPLKYKISSFSDTYTPNEGDVHVLVVPIDLSTASDASSYNLDTWSDEEIDFIDTQYFGTGDVGAVIGGPYRYWTFKDYYETTSHGLVKIDGEVSSAYKVSSTTTIEKILSDSTMGTLHDVFDAALASIQENNPNIDWSQYDLNNDGLFDSCHFISNYKGASWGESLWPHQGQTHRSKNNYIVADNYSLSSIEKFKNAQTCTHEQGHMFGLEDYYDYSEAPDGEETYSFLGSLDMQDSNWFDWNSFSKLVTGWANPTVITGEKDSVTVTLSDAATTGDCLLVPAAYSDFNNSPYDEYFLFELFSPKGNNELPWTVLEASSGLGSYGVRAYHVCGKAYGLDNRGYAYELFDKNGYPINGFASVASAACNSATCKDYGGDDDYDDYPLLSLVSKTDPSKYMKRNSTLLSSEDLWHEGDTFTWDSGKYAIKKGGEAASTMVNGDTFPYEITFDSMSKDSMTVTISKK